MRSKILLTCTLLLASSTVLAEQTLLEGGAKLAAKDTATAVAPATVEKAEQANQTIENAKNIKENADNAPKVLENQVKNTVKQRIDAAPPQEVKAASDAVKNSKQTVTSLKQTIKSAPAETKTRIKQKALEKAIDLLR